MRFVNYNVVENPTIDYKDITNPTNPFSEYNFNTTYNTPQGLVVPTREDSKPDTVEETPVIANNPVVEPVVNKPVTNKVTYTPKAYKGLAEFNKAYDEVEKSNPEAKKYRQFLTKMAEQESGFNSAIQNRAGAPAYGYFQFMQDDKKYNNIRQYAGTDIETFRSNPKLQIEAAIKLAKSFENGFSKEDLELAKKNGYSTWGLLGGAWLAGNGGVRKFLQGKGNPSDRHWSKEGKGTDVATRIKAFNFKEGGIVKYQNPSSGIQRIGKPVSVNNSEDGGYDQSTLNKRQELLKKWDPTGGFDAASWIASKFFGNMANGEENEYYKTYLGLSSKVQPMKPGAQTNWDYQEEERKKQAGEQPSDFYGTTPRMDYNIQAIADTLNIGKIVRSYDVYKQKEPSLPDKEYIERIYTSGKQVMENPSKWVQVEDGRAIKQGYDKQLEESDPLGMLGKFGMRWEPNQKALYVHDTYDFPWKARAATGIPVRPREMKIRGRINFDPNRGSVLLRDSLSGFNSKYPTPITDEE